MDIQDAAALTIHKAKIGKELASLSPELLRLIERAADWSGSRFAAERRTIKGSIARIRAEEEAERVRDMARLTLGECATHWMPEQIKASKAAIKARREAGAKAVAP